MFVGKRDTLGFLARAPEVLGSGDMKWFTLFADDRNGEPALYIGMRSELRDIDSARGRVKKTALFQHLKRLKFSYFGSIRPNNPPSWYDEWDGMKSLPHLVRVRLERNVGNRLDWPDLVVAPRITMDSSCIYDSVSRGCRGR